MPAGIAVGTVLIAFGIAALSYLGFLLGTGEFGKFVFFVLCYE